MQEHFKTVKTTQQWFSQQFREFHTYTTPAYRLPGVESGRGRGGLSQLASRELKTARARVVTRSPRLQAQILSFSNTKVLWVNAYLPCDPQSQQFDDSELLSVLNEVESLIISNKGCEIVWAADMNWDRSRDNHFTRTVAAFLTRLNLTSVWESKPIDYTHIHTNNVNTSIIDHFIVSHNLLQKIEACGPVHTGDNMSRHSPIFLSLNLGELALAPEDVPQPPPRRVPDWDRATKQEISDYKSLLQQKLQAVTVPKCTLHCQDTNCTDKSHNAACDNLVLNILCSVVEASYTKVPLTGNAGGVNVKKQIIPGWSHEVEPFRVASNTAYRTWLAAGKPSQGPLHQNKLRAHAQFRYAVRRVKRASQLHSARGLFEAALEGDIQLLKEMKRVKTGKCDTDDLPTSVDGTSGQANVANRFKDVFSALYNSVDDKNGLEAVEERISILLSKENNIAEVNKLTPDVVRKATMSLKSHKMDVSQGLSSDAFLQAPDLLFNLLSMVFKDWMTHGAITKTVIACALIPLLKGNKNPDESDSYRAIASSTIILKIFEKCILLVWGDAFHSDSLQFGFKRNCSTSTASWLANEVLQHYLRQGSRPIACVLDCSKAFDLAKFSLIFSRALDSGLPAVVVRVLLHSYKEQEAWVRWGRRCNSETFGFSNSTRQGSCASPALWSIYLDPLFARLREKGVGCHLAGLFVGVVGYCDDLLLLAPNREAAQIMLKICEEFAEESNIKFSTDTDPTRSKSKVIYVTGTRVPTANKPAALILCNRPLPFVERADHLGIALHVSGELKQDCREKRAQFIDKSAKIRETFKFGHPAEQIFAVEKYCSSGLHGASLWDLTSREAQMIFGSWRTGHKLAWQVDRNCHNYLVQETLAPGLMSLEARLLLNFVGFFKSILKSPNKEVAIAARLASRDVRTSVGKNLARIEQLTGLNPWLANKSLVQERLVQALAVEIPAADAWRPTLLHKLLGDRLEANYKANEEEAAKLSGLISSLVAN